MAKQNKKIGRPSYLKPSEFLHCPKCDTTKKESEFYNCKARPTGKQRTCKSCCRESGIYFRTVLRPEFYWSGDGSTGYFQKDYQKTLQYYREHVRADKIPLVYVIETPSGIYVGCTRALLNVRRLRHKSDYKRYTLGKKTNRMPLLHQAFDKCGADWVDWIDTMKPIETFDKSISQHELLKKEKEYIQKFEQQGIKLLNVINSKNDIRIKKNKKI